MSDCFWKIRGEKTEQNKNETQQQHFVYHENIGAKLSERGPLYLLCCLLLQGFNVPLQIVIHFPYSLQKGVKIERKKKERKKQNN